MTTKDSSNSATLQKKLSLGLALAVAVGTALLATPVWVMSFTGTGRHIIFNGDFEDGNLTRWGKEFNRDFKGKNFTKSGKEICCEHSVQIISFPTKESRYAAKFTLYKDDPDVAKSRRAELRLNAVATKSEYWYGFSTYLPPEFVKDPSMEIVSQWNARPDKNLGEKWRTPQLYLKTENGNWQIKRRWDHNRVTKNNTPAGKETIDIGPYQTGVWNDWVFHVKWSYESDGLVEVWKNGKLVVRKTGPNTYNDKIGPFQKFGIYKPDWKHRPHRSKTTKRVLYYDNVRMGGASARYGDVAP